ncbi:GNAT family N-acetyltransferase [Chitinophaga deserti]|uniref:GNAT family N-acetyltransferase n=1 Tax=Chitinophaga deserti TaxID=2164099 RepID=UPI000D6B81C1|nr:GNAT family N-acetyltransferase [Chitinophaga deserti]
MINVQPFSPEYAGQIYDFILHIQQKEFGLPVTREQQPDLADIPGVYQQGISNFWIAEHNGRLIGTISLMDLGEGKGALRKMFVHQDYRGREHGVALRLLEALKEWARTHEYSDIYLGTAEILHAAHRFYEKNGFVQVERNVIPDGPYIMPVDKKFYHYQL